MSKSGTMVVQQMVSCGRQFFESLRVPACLLVFYLLRVAVLGCVGGAILGGSGGGVKRELKRERAARRWPPSCVGG